MSRLLGHLGTQFCFLRMPELPMLISYIWIKRLRSVRPVNGFMVRFTSLQHDMVTREPLDYLQNEFRQNFQG